MTFTVETGAAIAGANSYATTDEADDYFFDRDLTAWTDAELTAKEKALLDASQYMDATYRWIGAKKTQAQGLGWPRSGACDPDGFPIAHSIVPRRVKESAFELALEALAADLLPPLERGGAIKRKLEKVDVIEEETEYQDGAPDNRTYPLVDRMLAGLYEGRAGGINLRVVRT